MEHPFRDGNLDVVAANNGSNDFTVLMGRGDGNFNNAQRFICAELYPVALALGPFFGSPIPDLAVLTMDRGTNVRHVRLVRNGLPAEPRVLFENRHLMAFEFVESE